MFSRKGISYLFVIMIISLTTLSVMNCGRTEKKDMTPEFTQFLKSYEAKVIPLSKDLNLAYFNATTTGNQDLYKKMEDLQIQLSRIFANKEDFALLKKIKESGTVTDPVLARQLQLIYNSYLAKQIDEKKLEKMIQLQTEVEQKYSTYRAEVDGEKLTDNQIEDILKTSTDSEKLKKTWMASKQIGSVVKDQVLQLVKMRNEAAQELGFKNYHAMQLELSEQNPDSIEQLFNELDDLTRMSFASLKTDIDQFLAKRYGISQADLMPWHYQNRFFQEAPKIYTVDLDKYYKNKDLVELTRKYYDGIGLNIDEMVKKSDLYEREGKYQHAYCTDIDREGDVRVVGNIQPNYNWMNTMLHEFGHAVYDEYHDRSLPWTLREPAHTFTTEAIAMLFGRFASNPLWLKDVV
ncbi:MAG: M2 family metallopeptidase, partial [Anaerolineales bacterium]